MTKEVSSLVVSDFQLRREVYLLKTLKWVSIIVAGLLTFGSLFFLEIGIHGVWDQHYKASRYKPVEATVLSATIYKSVIDTRFQKTPVVKPRVEYEYTVNGKTYKSYQVSIYKKQRGKKWSREVVSRYSKGQKITAYYNPNDPSDAFLIRQYIFLDEYGPILVGVVLLAVSIALWVCIYYEFRSVLEPAEIDSSWFEIRPCIPIKNKFKTAFLIACLWHTVGIIAFGHYFIVAEPPYVKDAFLSTIIYEGVGLFPVVLAIYYLSIISRVREARVFVNKDKVFLGDELVVRSEQNVCFATIIKDSVISLVCEEQVWVKESPTKDYSKKRRCYEARTSVLNESKLIPSEKIETEWSVTIPDDQNASSLQRDEIYANRPRYTWYIEVFTELRGRPHYKAKFPIVVQKLRA